MEPFEATADEAAEFRHQNGDRVDVLENKDGSWSVRFLKGAVILVPKALRFDRLVAAQIPTGWDPARYGIPEDTIKQVDIVTCYALVAAVEALVRSGITDPYELYRYFHVSEVGNSIGSAIGGANKLHHAFRDRFLDEELQNDVLQETFINTTAAWINMLLLSSSGPIKPTVGACATSVLSVEVAMETIQSGKAKIMLAGGFETFTEESSYEFAQMGATSNSLEELASGPAGVSPRLLDINYRRRQLDRQLVAINEWVSDELEELNSEADLGAKEAITTEAERQSLAVWGLTVDDIGVASFHGTSTVANDKNESEVLNRQIEHLGRTPGLAVPAICQKWLTGHSKGAAAAFMLNGVLQSLRTGIAPGNRNADNIAAELEKFEYIVYPSRSIQTPGIKAGLLKSFGFGQVGGEILVVHPDHLLAVLTREQLDEYTKKMQEREAKSYRYWQDTLVGNHPFVQVKIAPPYTLKQEQQVYLDPLARAKYDSVSKQYMF
ncbi:thiolase-like protein [Martensiomyces pterosporus]|nr:thiolase-like protein [Martensiomyces pterosporus]